MVAPVTSSRPFSAARSVDLATSIASSFVRTTRSLISLSSPSPSRYGCRSRLSLKSESSAFACTRPVPDRFEARTVTDRGWLQIITGVTRPWGGRHREVDADTVADTSAEGFAR